MPQSRKMGLRSTSTEFRLTHDGPVVVILCVRMSGPQRVYHLH